MEFRVKYIRLISEEVPGCRIGTEIDVVYERIYNRLKSLREENERLKKIIAKELSENDEFGAEFVHVSILKNEIELLKNKLSKLKRLVLLVDDDVSDTHMNELSVKQWTSYVKEYPDELN